jgi:hypothetical protein
VSDGFPEFKLLQKRIETLEREMSSLSLSVEGLRKESTSHRADLDRLVLMVIGDEDLGLRGIVERIKSLEDLIKSLIDDKARAQRPATLTLVGVVLTAVFTLSTLMLVVLRLS